MLCRVARESAASHIVHTECLLPKLETLGSGGFPLCVFSFDPYKKVPSKASTHAQLCQAYFRGFKCILSGLQAYRGPDRSTVLGTSFQALSCLVRILFSHAIAQRSVLEQTQTFSMPILPVAKLRSVIALGGNKQGLAMLTRCLDVLCFPHVGLHVHS